MTVRVLVLDGGQAPPAKEEDGAFFEIESWDRASILRTLEEDEYIYDGLDSRNANGDATIRDTFAMMGNIATIERNTDGEIYVFVRMPDEPAELVANHLRPPADHREGAGLNTRGADTPSYDVTIRATVTKTIRVTGAASEAAAIEEAHQNFTVCPTNEPEKYSEEYLSIKEISENAG
jgi:hypothetical protein